MQEDPDDGIGEEVGATEMDFEDEERSRPKRFISLYHTLPLSLSIFPITTFENCIDHTLSLSLSLSQNDNLTGFNFYSDFVYVNVQKEIVGMCSV